MTTIPNKNQDTATKTKISNKVIMLVLASLVIICTGIVSMNLLPAIFGKSNTIFKSTRVSCSLMGDVDRNGIINCTDVNLIFDRYLKKPSANNINIYCANVNGIDGLEPTPADARALVQVHKLVCGTGSCNLIGDVDSDGKQTCTDASLIFNYYLDNLSNTQPFNLYCADVDNDNHVTPADAQELILYYPVNCPEQQCAETDNGNDPAHKGTILYKSLPAAEAKATDYCVTYSSKTMVEYFCVGNSGDFSSASIVCDNGCFDGRCTNRGEKCIPGRYCYNNYSHAAVDSNCRWSDFRACNVGEVCQNGGCIPAL
ncbi:MAG: dockerin type I domain-containing protein [Patescibacteria group bacterium]|jgi:hypothetical protein